MTVHDERCCWPDQFGQGPHRDCPGLPHPWDVHDDSCDCHIGICMKCGCTNEVEREAALTEPSLDVERLAATEWAYDTMPESFDVMRDPVAAWNDRLYPATDHDKERYRRRAAAIVARLRGTGES